MSYPKITFKKVVIEPGPIKTKWSAYVGGEYLGDVAQSYTGGWTTSESISYYSTRYEAAYSLYIHHDRKA